MSWSWCTSKCVPLERAYVDSMCPSTPTHAQYGGSMDPGHSKGPLGHIYISTVCTSIYPKPLKPYSKPPQVCTGIRDPGLLAQTTVDTKNPARPKVPYILGLMVF